MKRLAWLVLLACGLTGCEPVKRCHCTNNSWHPNCVCSRCDCRPNYKCCPDCPCNLDGNLTPAQKQKELDRLTKELEKLEK